MINLSEAINCIEVMQREEAYKNHKIGIIKKAVDGVTSLISGIHYHEAGAVVLFREEIFPTDSQLAMGEYMGRIQKPTGTVTIESPLPQKDIDKQKAQCSLLRTVGTIVGVPKSYVEGVRLGWFI